MSKSSTPGVRVAVLGDLMLAGEWTDHYQAGQLAASLGDIAGLGNEFDFLFANLEVTLPGTEGEIEKQPRLVGSADAVNEALRILNVDIVNLSNNHAFDCFESGFAAICDLLLSRGVGYLGAGVDLMTASRPLISESGDVKLGWLGYTALDTVPSHVATAEGYGVNPFEIDKVLKDIENLKLEVDHVLVSVHWGVEFSNLPSPLQILQARRMIDTGATAILGHHAHVIQGFEDYRGGVIAYNLGNAVTTDLEIDGRPAIRQTDRSRSAFLLDLRLSKTKVLGYQARAFRFENGTVNFDDPLADRFLERANQAILRGVSDAQWRRRRLYEDVVLRAARKLNPRVIGSVRPSHFAKVFRNVARAVKGQGPA